MDVPAECDPDAHPIPRQFMKKTIVPSSTTATPRPDQIECAPRDQQNSAVNIAMRVTEFARGIDGVA
ncbi:hypothetical protein A3E39_02985 [Candidatus Uhrbacteria bacterium RIFCSPHIGHO2_12_FULL_60_25]|uniref:Uncharacterized protein n=1 Tax=Candidatus Uhrbacteria bacterium RIFCSPHIGHO2_12_FULL_60_25 TaxID=1802399 RepID=A0A1F7UIW6_9BACT|nr:MAG: hypothetical protein A3D73_00335 [Candidatus Uhrbacteria bacterium RIFCSPHIGHO2_02_FULL_60_44]OGL78195.1 MAG: hypothetical protein A3E39_02985 [Candidatus Uhrbacteria bacterium RIFCSPHIGHO2_12_FULL_60_25]